MQDLTLGLFGKVAIVTGAARGIGRSTVELLTAHGVRIVAEDISPTVNDLARPGKVVTMVGDCAEESTAVGVVQRALGCIDIFTSAPA